MSEVIFIIAGVGFPIFIFYVILYEIHLDLKRIADSIQSVVGKYDE